MDVQIIKETGVAELRRIARFRTKEGKTHYGILRDEKHLAVIDGSVYGGYKLHKKTYRLS